MPRSPISRAKSACRHAIRSSIGAAIVFVGLAGPAAAADPTAVYWRQQSGTEPDPSYHYRVGGDGTNNVQYGVYPTHTDKPSSRAVYPGGRRMFAQLPAGLIPGTSISRYDLALYAEQPGFAPVVLTEFDGPTEFIESGVCRWSNDGLDSFFTFQAYDATTGRRVLYRYGGSMADLFAPGFAPFVPNDPRLVRLTEYDRGESQGSWNASGTRLTIISPAAWGRALKIFDATTGATAVVNDPAQTGVSFRNANYSPTEDRVFGVAETPGGVRGLASYHPGTGQFLWILKEGGTGKSRVWNFNGPISSPDGASVSFSLLRVVSGSTRPTIARISVGGGAYTPLATLPASGVNQTNPIGWFAQ